MFLTTRQEKVLIGTMLGDAHIQEARTKSLHCRLRLAHSIKQKDYVDWKYNVFKSICKTTRPPTTQFDKKKGADEYSFYSSYSAEMRSYRALWYPFDDSTTKDSFLRPKIEKILPTNISDILIDPLSLAVWYHVVWQFKTFQNFGESGALILQECLKNNFAVDSKIDKWRSLEARTGKSKNIFGLAVLSRKGRYKHFRSIIEDIIRTEVPSMSYKI